MSNVKAISDNDLFNVGECESLYFALEHCFQIIFPDEGLAYVDF